MSNTMVFGCNCLHSRYVRIKETEKEVQTLDQHETAFRLLKAFIDNQMPMFQMYQPVMLVYLLEQDGDALADNVTEVILMQDDPQLRYYCEIVKKMRGQVPCKRDIAERGPVDSNLFFLKGFRELPIQGVNDFNSTVSSVSQNI